MHVYLVANKQNLQLIAERETIDVSLFDFNAEFWFIWAYNFPPLMDKWMESYFLEHLDIFFSNRRLNGYQILFKKKRFKGILR